MQIGVFVEVWLQAQLVCPRTDVGEGGLGGFFHHVPQLPG